MNRQTVEPLQADRPVVSCRDLTKTYSMGEYSLQVLRGVSFDVRPGEFVAIMGPSGSGKSTLLNLIGALDTPTTGNLTIGGTDVSGLSDDELAHLRNRVIGFVFQQFNLLRRTSALDNVKLPLLYSTSPAEDMDEMARKSLVEVGLDERQDHTPAQLSGGQQQRVAIARALVTAPQLILADEPTGALDTQTSRDIMELFTKLHHTGMTIIMVTHEADIAAYAERLLRFRDGVLEDDVRQTPKVMA
ncbi:MAG TPA: ABC transporter ATP-binding protein [Hyphomicrobiales bacterium]|nr:ABC transporter ATP-binding protein [Hyphomicrobiales bacterium]